MLLRELLRKSQKITQEIYIIPILLSCLFGEISFFLLFSFVELVKTDEPNEIVLFVVLLRIFVLSIKIFFLFKVNWY